MNSIIDDEEKKKREKEFDQMFSNSSISKQTNTNIFDNSNISNSNEYTKRANEFDLMFGNLVDMKFVQDKKLEDEQNKIEEQIKQEPYIKEAEVKRSFPNKIQITVQERERAFSAEFLNGYAYIDNQGYILQISNDSLGLPIIQGISTPEDKIVAGNRLEEEDLQKLETAIQIMNICKSNNLDSKVTSIDITNRNDYSIYMEAEKKTIYLGDGKNLGDKMLWVQAILEDNQGIEGEIYVNGDLTQNFKPRFKQKV
mgnify:CR=1 FL=1